MITTFQDDTPIRPPSKKTYTHNCFINIKYEYQYCVLYLFTCFANHEPKLMFIVAIMDCILLFNDFALIFFSFVIQYELQWKNKIWIIIQVMYDLNTIWAFIDFLSLC